MEDGGNLAVCIGEQTSPPAAKAIRQCDPAQHISREGTESQDGTREGQTLEGPISF
jgi:hypothetical protein